MRRAAAVLAVVAATSLVFAGCGRSLPDEPAATAPEGGDPTGAFGDEGLSGTIEVAGSPAGVKLVEAAAQGFRREEPDVEVAATSSAARDAVARLCAGRLDIAAVDRALNAKERRSCETEADGAVELHVAGAGGKPVSLVTTNAVLFERFEVEGLLQHVLDNAQDLAGDSGLEPLSVDELDETQTAFEQALAGI